MVQQVTKRQIILVTGATGFIGAHVVDELLGRGYKVRATTRSAAKGEEMSRARPDVAGQLEFILVGDLGTPGGFDEAMKGVDGVIHCAANVSLQAKDPEKEIILSSIDGTRAVLLAASREFTVKRVVLTSSFSAMVQFEHHSDLTWKYTAEHWNTFTYEQGKENAGIAYSVGKKLSEQAAWDFIREEKPHFDLVTIVPPIVFGPPVHPVAKVSDLNYSLSALAAIAAGEEYPTQHMPVWVDVRDIAEAHAEALVRPEASNTRYTVGSPKKYTHQRVADILREEFDWAREVVRKGDEGAPLPLTYGFDGETAGKALGLSYRSLRESIVDFAVKYKEIAQRN